ncbi:maleylpyruvate isomerase family mycothiol-dependent enzyme [Nocardioides sp. HDW12B]|uniref:maleylpyruvate isomerase N-terminal domain-containing protein n=1 Tax=Nocardioides sp. HDW12B TaxID=2714939 RepID=UPI00140DDF83|nr:maleylpyruvate isomerase N-terminal domain-containing protein [Nocardioides sp. HDW12B]QIK65010.1 maleylpyruvate isomerase family mycothiol-dependent enzyme [Nocardioides sp. HDW12B]
MDSATPAEPGLDFVEEFASAAEWFATHLGRTSARAPVPACPDWSVLDLVAHLGNVHAWAATVVETGAKAEQLDDRPSSARSRRVSEWYLAKAEDLYEVLRAADPSAPCWTFVDDAGTAAFWARRQAHETVVHGFDLAVAGDHEPRVPPRLAVDGVSEVLEVFLGRMHRRGHPAVLHRALELRATDAEESWVLEPAPVGIPAQGASPEQREERPTTRAVPVVTRGSRDDLDRIEAPAATLLTLLWRRTRPDAADVRLVGNEDRLRAFLQSRLTP